MLLLIRKQMKNVSAYLEIGSVTVFNYKSSFYSKFMKNTVFVWSTPADKVFSEVRMLGNTGNNMTRNVVYPEIFQ